MTVIASYKLSNCKKMRRAGDLKSMSSKTILLGLTIFRYSSERTMRGNLSWELAPYNCESERSKDFTMWCRDVSTECCFKEHAGECGVVHFTSKCLVLNKSKSIPIRIGRQLQLGKHSGTTSLKTGRRLLLIHDYYLQGTGAAWKRAGGRR